MKPDPRLRAGACNRTDTRLRIATTSVCALLALTDEGCTKPPAAPFLTAPLIPAPAPAPPPTARTHRAMWDGEPARIKVSITGNQQVSSDDLFAVMRLLKDEAVDQDTLERDMLMLSALSTTIEAT